MAERKEMPARGHATAPRFSPDEPRELRRYFKDLNYLMRRAGITEYEDMKDEAIRYVDISTADCWEALAEYKNTHSYNEFVDAVQKLYPGAQEERKWSSADLRRLVSERAITGMYNADDLGSFYRSFYTITEFLISKERLSKSEQSREFAKGFRADLWARVMRRLEIKLPDQHPDDVFPLEAIREAAEFVLHGATPSTDPPTKTILQRPANAAPPLPETEATAIKSELALLTAKIDLMTSAMNAGGATKTATSAGSQSFTSQAAQAIVNSLNPGGCNFCGVLGHRIGICPEVDKFMREGKVRRNDEGRVVLSNGQYCPRAMKGDTMLARIDEWHRLNPGQKVGGALSANANPDPEPAKTMLFEALVLAEAPAAAPVLTQSYQLHPSARIAVLEHELMVLRGKQTFDGVEVPRLKKAATAAPSVAKEPPAPKKASSSKESPVIPIAEIEPTASTSGITEEVEEHPIDPPIHPFANLPEAQYVPPSTRNFAALPDKPLREKDNAAYRTIAPIVSAKIAEDVYIRSMRAPCITLSSEELLSLSPDVRNRVRDAVTAKRIMTTDPSKPVAVSVLAELPFTGVEDIEEAPIMSINAIIIPDPYETYLNSLQPGDCPEVLVVAKESHALRSIQLLVDAKAHVEAIVDPGSQIIAMSEAVCHTLGLSYDPRVILQMQSANGGIDPSLGLARNVPCAIGNITFYLQIHVVREPAYDILLGRPFDVLTQSMVKNFANEDQTITVEDPNTGAVATIPTQRRGPPRFKSCPHQKKGNF